MTNPLYPREEVRQFWGYASLIAHVHGAFPTWGETMGIEPPTSREASEFDGSVWVNQDKFDHDKGQKSAISNFEAPSPLEALHWIFFLFLQYLCAI